MQADLGHHCTYETGPVYCTCFSKKMHYIGVVSVYQWLQMGSRRFNRIPPVPELFHFHEKF